MRRLFAALAVSAVLTSGLTAQTPKRLFGLEDVARIKNVSDPQMSPDGGWVAYSVRTPDLKADRNSSDIWMTSWDGQTTVRLTTGKESETSPRWSPDGKSLAFLSSRDDDNEVSQVWLLPRAGGEAEKLTSEKGGVEDYDWSPDGKKLVLVVADPDPDDVSGDEGKASGKKKTKKPIVIDRYQFKSDGTGYLDQRRHHLSIVDLATRKSEVLTTGKHDEELPAWSPDGKTIAFVSKRMDEADRTDNWDIWAIEPRQGATPRALTSDERSDNQPEWGSRLAWSPDSKWIAYVQGGPDKLIYYGLHRLAVVPAGGGTPRILTADVDLNVLSPRYSEDGSAILFTLEDDQAVGLAQVPGGGGAVQRLVTGRRVVAGFDTAIGRVAIQMGTSLLPDEIYAVDKDAKGEPRRLSRQNDALLAEIRLGAVEETKLKSKDGTEIHGFLVKPPDYQAGKTYPTILRIHGGPVGQYECSFEEEWQWFAANGYVVVAANPRGSSGRGEKFQTAIWADWGNVDTQDVLAAVDDAVARGIADPNRLAVGGWSYGSMLTNYVIATTRRFKAATSGAGSSNPLAGYGSDQYIREYEQELGPPWKNLDGWLKVSYPFVHADRITTPTLFLCGEADFNMPVVGSEQMYQALRSLGVPTQLVIYPGQHHGLRKPSYVRDRLERYVAWYDKYAKNATPAAGGISTTSGR
jgi:dipeptidyl aminopeptidase/acylaminoacyl peptidase